jgi:uncharacterized membrane protein (UPF0136 family)
VNEIREENSFQRQAPLGLLFCQRGSVVEILIGYFLGIVFLVAGYLVFSLYFEQKPIAVFVGLLSALTLLVIFGLIRSLTRKKIISKKPKF